MKMTKKVVLLLVFCALFLGFVSSAMAREVLYMPFEFYQPLEPGMVVRIFLGETLSVSYPFVDGNPVQVPGKVGYAFEFNGDDWINLGTSNPTQNFGYDDFAITFMVKTTSTKINNTICDKRDSLGVGFHVTLYQGRVLLQLHDSNYGQVNYINSYSTSLTDGKWHHVAIYVDRNDTTGGKIYVDGLCVLTFNPTVHTGSLTNSAPFYLGKHSTTLSNNFVGTIDEYRHFRFIPK